MLESAEKCKVLKKKNKQKPKNPNTLGTTLQIEKGTIVIASGDQNR